MIPFLSFLDLMYASGVVGGVVALGGVVFLYARRSRPAHHLVLVPVEPEEASAAPAAEATGSVAA